MKYVLTVDVIDDVIEKYKDLSINYVVNGVRKDNETIESINYPENVSLIPLSKGQHEQCNDYLNNALRVLLRNEPSVDISLAIQEIICCIQVAGGYFFEDVEQSLKERGYWKYYIK